MLYNVLLAREAERNLAKIPKSHHRAIFAILTGLETEPFLGKPLKGQFKGYYSIRAWPYRIIYRIEKKKLIVYVLSIPHRKDAYK
jgi:addiction module RelE/StbE family toxin